MKFSFQDNQEVADLATVPDEFRPFYAEKSEGEGFTLQNDNPIVKSAVKVVGGLNTALNAARAEAQANKGKAVDLSGLSDYGSNVEEIQAGVSSRVQELTEKLASTDEAKLDLNKVREDLGKAHAKDIQRSADRIAALEAQLYTLLVENTATSAIADAKGSPELLMPFIKNQVKVVEEDGAMNVYVVDKDGAQRFSGATQLPMTVDELVAEMKGNAQFGRLFDSEAPTGGGTLPAAGPSRIQKPAADMTPQEKIASGLRKGRTRLRAGAGS